MGEKSISRQTLRDAERIVVKIGTRVLVNRNGCPNLKRLQQVVQQVSALHRVGKQVIVVSSGAIGAGIETLGLPRRPTDLPGLQMAAAVGQSRLMMYYAQLFAQQQIVVGQVLLTHDDLRHRRRHLNARHTLMQLLHRRVVPIVNENDVVSVDEIRFSDNDHLAALVTVLADAQLLVLMTTINGLQAPSANGGKLKRVPFLEQVDEQVMRWVWPEKMSLSTGGMALKLQAAQTAHHNGAAVALVDGRKPQVLQRLILAGNDVGTLIGSVRQQRALLPSRKRWIAFFHRPEGTLVVDDGAADALQGKGKSLLPIGVVGVDGRFEVGALVNVNNRHGVPIGRGLVEYNSCDMARIMGRPTREVASILGVKPYDEVIHRDNIVVF